MLLIGLTLASLPLLSIAALSGPNVTTTYGTWVGANKGGVEAFLGIPYAQAPIGNLRFAPPKANAENYGVFDASNYDIACPQMSSSDGASATAFSNIDGEGFALLGLGPQTPAGTKYGEDCLTVNVQRPVGTKQTAKLPVMVFIYGGAFIQGSSPTYNGSNLVLASAQRKQNIIYVSMNYRLASFGFLPGKEAGADKSVSINAGLLDQRMALEWVQDNIAAFGGDKSKVTIFGESAGAISVGFQITAYGGDISYKGKPLFRAAIMESGAPYSARGPAAAQNSFDVIAKATGCFGVKAPIACLRAVPYEKLLNATNLLPSFFGLQSVAIPFGPRTDGAFIPEYAANLIAKGKYAKIPIITGNQYDEGTTLTWGTKAIDSSAKLEAWLAAIWAPGSSKKVRQQLLALYPAAPSAGSPFDTGLASNFTGQNKRISAIVGDEVFQYPRRYFLKYASATQPAWSYSSRAFQNVLNLGSYHGSELQFVFGTHPSNLTTEFQSRWIQFANTLTPNVVGLPNWPQYGKAKNLLQFSDKHASTVVPDTYRKAAIQFFADNAKFLIR